MATDPNAAALEQEAATGTGIPESVTHQQALAESGESDSATSGAGAEGFWQFEPTTYNAYAAQAGVPANSEYNAADETKVYVLFMNSLLQQEGGNIYKALEAYNAGPGNLGAGAGYAAGIEAKAGVPQSQTAGQASTASADFSIPNPLAPLIGGAASGAVGSAINDIASGLLSALGVGTIKELVQRTALILLGVALLLVGLNILVKGNSKQPITVNTSTDAKGATTQTRTVRSPVSRHTRTVKTGGSVKSAGKEAGKSVASEAIEAAAIA
jgi:hypothetical protein